jgi:hypothetical protein
MERVMKMRKNYTPGEGFDMKKYMILLLIILLSTSLFGQAKLYEGPNDPAGDPQAEREGFMTGNRIYLYFQNTTELSRYPKSGSRWPDTYEGLDMVDGIGLLIGARVYVKNDTIPVSDPAEILSLAAKNQLDTLYFLQTSYREEMDTDPTGQVEWGLYPCFGYFDKNSETPAMSNKSDSWPVIGWPSSGNEPPKWAGEWNGRFGRGVKYADLETFFVTNDAQDQEYILRPDGTTKYIPRPGVYIGDHPTLGNEVTVQRGKPWGGLGIRVEQRGFQWNNPQARDAIFWEYNIANISDYTIKDVAFGYWVDNGIGGGGTDDDLGFFDRYSDLAYSWDVDGVGAGGFPTGLMGFAYLESPGIPNDYKDNDQDGLVDEQRDNDAGSLIGPMDGITDLDAFLTFYKLKQEDLKEHYEGDEDQDWMDGEDLNGNGVYDLGENPGDDLGLDGVGPGDLNYTGPDEGECNHMPDYKEGYGCEPNFNATDVSESDMVGLTSFQLFPIQPHRPPYTKWFRNDKSMWEVVGSDSLIEYLGNIANLVETFASGPFTLPSGRTERISMSQLHSFDPLEGLTEENGYAAPSLFEKKRIVQVIYEKDYRFAQPPYMPTLTATPLDGKVILTWDDMADTKTRDPFLGNINDFEGYKLYRSTDKKMQDAEVITDGYGDAMFKKPIFQCDKKDNIIGFTNFGLVNGMGFNLGSDTGIRHYFIDENVQNGRTYYYAIVAYDYGAEDIGPGIAPSENNIIIDLDEAEEITSKSKNVQVVTPHQIAAGYVEENITMLDTGELLGCGEVVPEVLAKKALNTERVYEVTFNRDTIKNIEDYEYGLIFTNSGITVKDAETQSILYEENAERFSGTNLLTSDSIGSYYINNNQTIKTDVFDGLRLNITLPVITAQVDYSNSGWITGEGMVKVAVSQAEGVAFPWEYDIIFGDTTDVLYTGRGIGRRVRDEDNVSISRDLINDANLPFKAVNKSITDSEENYELLDAVVHDKNKNGKFDMLQDRVIFGVIDTLEKWAGTVMVMDFSYANGNPDYLPKSGDVYHLSFKRPFWKTDKIQFTVNAHDSLDTEGVREDMKNIKVVPNPYIATNTMEGAVLNEFLNQRRRLLFTHLPAQCRIKIFTVSGVLVDEIKVNNTSDDGTAHWDMKTREDLEVAAGMYIYHVKSDITGDEKMGKFAIIK